MKLDQRKILVLLIIALGIRIGFALIFHGPDYFGGISQGYIEAAENVLHGHGFNVMVDEARITEPPKFVSTFFFMRPVAYSIFLAGVFSIFGENLIFAQLIQALIGALSAFLVYMTTKKIFDEATAGISLVIAAVFLPMARFDVILLPDAMVGVLLIIAIYFLLKENHSGVILFGIFVGLTTEFRPDAVLLPIFLIPYFIVTWKFKKAFIRFVEVFAVIILILIPNTIANYEATHKIIPLGIGNGISMWEGISQFGNRFGTVFGDQKAAAAFGYRTWWYPNGVERDQTMMKEAVDIIIHHPIWYAGMLVKRTLVVFTVKGLFPAPVEYQQYEAAHPGASYLSYLVHEPVSALIKIFWALVGWALFILAVLGFYAAVKEKKWRLAFPVALTIFYYFAIHIPTNAEPRYFFPMFGFEIMLASYYVSTKSWKRFSPLRAGLYRRHRTSLEQTSRGETL